MHKNCINSKRIHGRPIKLNQNSYRSFRSNPPKVCFRSVFIDHIGPFTVNLNGEKMKTWILIVSCLYSRAINLKICRDLSGKEFMNALQLHCHEFGMFAECMSDLGSSIVSGANTIKAFLSDHETQSFLGANGVKEVSFHQYAKGNSSLGSLVESSVKQVKFLIQKSIKTNVLDYFDFQFLVSKAVNMINKRPVAFKEQLGSLSPTELPTCITPEMMLYGRECPTVNLIPQLQPLTDEYTPDTDKSLADEYEKLRRVKERLVEVYHEDFMVNLISQAVDKPERYQPVPHQPLAVGDVVLLADKHLKQYLYPMGRVLSVETNSLGEATSARILKGDTGEIVRRHVTSLILLLSGETCVTPGQNEGQHTEPISPTKRPPSNRKAAKQAREKIGALLGDE